MRAFQFKKFAVEQSLTAMKVGTDGVLLGAWSRVEGDRVLDIGSGCGLIALMIAQRNSNATVDGVEINSESAAEAKENFERSPWSDRLNVYNVDIQSYRSDSKYNHIVTNPPFFLDSLGSPDRDRNIARHSVELSFEDLISAVDRLLSGDGRLSIILPPMEMEHFERIAKDRLKATRRCLVYGREGGALKRILMEFARVSSGVEQQSLTLENRDQSENRYSEEYRKLTHDFYLKF